MVYMIDITNSVTVILGQIPLDCSFDTWIGYRIACSVDFTKTGEKQLITISQMLQRVGASLNILDMKTLTWSNIYCNIKYKGTYRSVIFTLYVKL